MKAFPEMIAPAAEEAGIKLPPDLENYEASQYPHWLVFCRMQLGQPMPYPSVDWGNAKIVAAISNEEITKVTPEELVAKGFAIGLDKRC